MTKKKKERSNERKFPTTVYYTQNYLLSEICQSMGNIRQQEANKGGRWSNG